MHERSPASRRRRTREGVMALALLSTVTGCGLSASPGATPPGGKLDVVAVEGFWGSVAGQLGGAHARVTSIVVNPATDPHTYEATPADAATIARARYVIVNGAGYDTWAEKLLDANPVAGRKVLNVGVLVGRKEGDNPHLWYSPDYVDRFIDRVTADLQALDPTDAPYFNDLRTRYRDVGLRDYHGAIAAIRQRHAGTAVGATESIFVYLATAANLDLRTPPDFMKAVSEGAEPSAADRATVQAQVARREVRVLVFNSQNTTPDVDALVGQARARTIPVVAITETMTPAGATFQAWQTAQLKALLEALGG